MAMEDGFDGICELVLESDQLGPMVEFYERLGLKVISREPGRVWLAVGPATRIGIWTPGKKEHQDRGGTHVHFALSLARGDLDDLGAELKAGDPEFEGPVDHEGGDRSMYLFDPEGNRVELWDYFREGEGAESGVDGLAQVACPSCDASLQAPSDRSESLGETTECRECKHCLVWFADDQVGGKWILDEAAEGRRRMAEGPGDIESPATT